MKAKFNPRKADNLDYKMETMLSKTHDFQYCFTIKGEKFFNCEEIGFPSTDIISEYDLEFIPENENEKN